MAASMAQLVQDEMFEYTSTVSGNREFARLHVAPENGWLIISGIDRASRMATIGDILMSMVSVVLAMLINLALLLYVLYLLKPLNLLTRALNDIANGEGDLTVRLPETGAREIADASRYFNQTMEKIRGLIVTIKKQAGTLSTMGDDLASNMAETASSVNQIAANIQNVKSRIMNQSASVTQTN